MAESKDVIKIRSVSGWQHILLRGKWPNVKTNAHTEGSEWCESESGLWMSSSRKRSTEKTSKLNPTSTLIESQENCGFQVARQRMSGMKLSNKETAAVLWQRRRQRVEAALLWKQGGVCERTGRQSERFITDWWKSDSSQRWGGGYGAGRDSVPLEQSTTRSAASLHTCQTRKVGFTAKKKTHAMKLKEGTLKVMRRSSYRADLVLPLLY